MYLKRNKIEKFWPVPRKGTKYLAVPTHNIRESIPLVVLMRDVLKLVRNKKELKKIISEKQIKINNKEIRETNYPICLFDVLSLKNLDKNYRATLSENKKMVFEEVKGKEAETKPFKVINKKTISGKKTQLNLSGGRNIISREKVNTGDTVLFNFKENKVVKIIPMEKGKKAFVVRGKHVGDRGEIMEILDRGGKKLAKISSKHKRINVWVRNIVAVD